jgi:hypothetical protein
MGNQAAPEYLFDISHAASSSTEKSACSVEPGSAEDVSKIVRYPDPTHRLLPTLVFIAMYFGIGKNALCRERWRTCHQSEIFLDERRTDCDDTL